eukprot:scaffold4518_cov410-Prasinococcus_capsulatus_cf.AAC.35
MAEGERLEKMAERAELDLVAAQRAVSDHARERREADLMIELGTLLREAGFKYVPFLYEQRSSYNYSGGAGLSVVSSRSWRARTAWNSTSPSTSVGSPRLLSKLKRRLKAPGIHVILADRLNLLVGCGSAEAGTPALHPPSILIPVLTCQCISQESAGGVQGASCLRLVGVATY